MQHLAAQPVEDLEADIGAVLGWVDIDTEWALAEGRVDDVDNGIGNGRGIRIRRHNGRESLLHLFAEAGTRRRAGRNGRSGWSRR